MIQRHLLYQCEGKDAAKIVTAKLANLEAVYLKAHKRKLPVEIFISSWGDTKSPSIGLTAYYTAEQRADLDFLIKNLS